MLKQFCIILYNFLKLDAISAKRNFQNIFKNKELFFFIELKILIC